MYPTQSQNTTSEILVNPSSFSDFCREKNQSPEALLARYQQEIQHTAARAEASWNLDPCEVIFNGQWRYLPNLEGRHDSRQSYKAELDELGLPKISFKTFRHGGAFSVFDVKSYLLKEFSGSDNINLGLISASTDEELLERRKLYEAKKQEAEKRKAEGQQAAAALARLVWNNSPLVQNHPYLKRKRVPSLGLRVATQDYKAKLYRTADNQWREVTAVREGDLLIPMFDESGTLVNLQRIINAGGNENKRFLLGGKTSGLFFPLLGNGSVVLCEGYATGASWHEATNDTVVVCFSAGNLPNVAKIIPADLVAADNDESGTGEKYARATGLPYAMPPNKGEDWNDYALQFGIKALTLATACYKAPIYERPWELPRPHIQGGIAAWRDRLAQAKTPEEAAALAWGLARKLGLGVPQSQALDELGYQLLRAAPIGLLNPQTVEAIKTLLEWIGSKRKKHSLAGFRILERRLPQAQRCKVLKTNTLPILTPDDYKGVILISAPMGAGKTKLIGRPFAQWCKEQHQPTIAICHRQSMVYELSRVLGLPYYKDKESRVFDANELATCLPSIVKDVHSRIIDSAKYVFIDEVGQVYRSLAASVSPADGKSPADVLAKLRTIIANAECLIGTDATLDNDTVEFILSCRPEEEQVTVIVQDPVPLDIEAEYGYGKAAYSDLLMEISVSMREENGKWWIACGERKRAKEVAEYLKVNTGLPVLLLHGENRGDRKSREFWKDPEGVSKNYAAVVATGVISSGLSIEHKDGQHFTNGALITSGATITHVDAVQMLRRVRYLKRYSLAVLPSSKTYLTNLEGILESIQKAAREQGLKSISLTDYDKLKTSIETRDDSFKADFAGALWWALEYLGYKLKRRPAREDEGEDEELKEIRRRLKQEHIDRILEAPDIDPNQALDLKSNPEPTEDESYALLRYRIRTDLGLGPGQVNEEAIQAWEGGRGPKKMDRFMACTKGLVQRVDKLVEDPNLTLHRFPRAITKAYRTLFKGYKIDPFDTKITQEMARTIIDRVRADRCYYAYLGIVPKKWRNKMEPIGAYPVKELGQILALMGLKIRRRELGIDNEDSKTPLRQGLPQNGQISIGEKSSCGERRVRNRVYVIDPASWIYIQAWAERRFRALYTEVIPAEALEGDSQLTKSAETAPSDPVRGSPEDPSCLV